MLRHASSRDTRRVPVYRSKSSNLQGMLPFMREIVRLGLRPIALYGDAAAARMAADDASECGNNRNAQRKEQATLFRCIHGNPFCSVHLDQNVLMWNDQTLIEIAQAIYTDRAFDRLPILADALEDAGCDNADILAHCRGPGPHVRGCWVVDLILGKT